MNKKEYNEIYILLQKIDDLMNECHSNRNFEDNENHQWENNLFQARNGMSMALMEIKDVLDNYDKMMTPDVPEYTIEFFPNNPVDVDNNKFKVTRTSFCHRDTTARLCFCIDSGNDKYRLTNITTDDFDYSTRDNEHFLTSVDIRSGKNGKFYQLVPKFTDKTFEYMQRTPLKKYG